MLASLASLASLGVSLAFRAHRRRKHTVRRGLGTARTHRPGTTARPPVPPGCLAVGRGSYDYPGSPVNVCLTKTQRTTLFRGQSPSTIACGTFACAYDHADQNKVVKITRDSEDVAGLVRAQDTGLVPKVYKAYQLAQGGTNTANKTVPMYGMVVQRLKPLSRAEQAAVWPHIDAMRYAASGLLTIPEACMRPDSGVLPICEEVVTLAQKLHAKGIEWLDIHPGNVGRDQRGKLLALDLGQTSTPLGPLPVLRGRQRLARQRKQLRNGRVAR